MRSEVEYWYSEGEIRELVDMETLERMLRCVTSDEPDDVDCCLTVEVIKTMGLIKWDFMSQNGRAKLEWLGDAVNEARNEVERRDELASAYGVVRRYMNLDREKEDKESHVV